MRLKYYLLAMLMGLLLCTQAQEHITKSGRIDFISKSPLFTVEGVNKKVASILNSETGELIVSLLIRSFEFEETVMEEQFNGNYMESKSFPKSIFKGRISNFKEIDFETDGVYDAYLEGKLTIHGITQYIQEKAVIKITDGTISAESGFYILLSDYKIQIEKAFKNSINDKVMLKIDFKYIKN